MFGTSVVAVVIHGMVIVILCDRVVFCVRVVLSVEMTLASENISSVGKVRVTACQDASTGTHQVLGECELLAPQDKEVFLFSKALCASSALLLESFDSSLLVTDFFIIFLDVAIIIVAVILVVLDFRIVVRDAVIEVIDPVVKVKQ